MNISKMKFESIYQKIIGKALKTNAHSRFYDRLWFEYIKSLTKKGLQKPT